MAVRLPPMQALRAFEAAARERSLTRAAQALNVTHGAISHQIKSLESDLGVRLVERSGRGIRLTDDGERFASRVRAAFAELTTAVHEITARCQPETAAGERRAFLRRALASAAHSGFPRDPSGRRPRRALEHGQRRFPARRLRRRHSLWPRRLAGRHGRASSRRLVLPGVQPGHRERAAFRPVLKILPDIRYLRSDDEPWKPWFDAAGLDWPEPTRGPIFSDLSHGLQAAIEGHGVALARSSLLAHDVRNGILVRPFDIKAAGAAQVLARLPVRAPRTRPSSRCSGNGCTTRSRPSSGRMQKTPVARLHAVLRPRRRGDPPAACADRPGSHDHDCTH